MQEMQGRPRWMKGKIGPVRFRYVPFRYRNRMGGCDERQDGMALRRGDQFGRGGLEQARRAQGEQTAGHGVLAVRGGGPLPRVMRAGGPGRCHARLAGVVLRAMAFTTVGHHTVPVRLRTGIPDQRQDATGEQHNRENGSKKAM